FKRGIPFVHLDKAAVVGHGILRFSPGEQRELIAYFEAHSGQLDLLLFVPASGAASRMFKALFSFLWAYDSQRETISSYVNRCGDCASQGCVEQMDSFPCYGPLMESLRRQAGYKDGRRYLFVRQLLSEAGFNYAAYPKGRLPVHRYDTQSATPFEEHLK